MPASAASASRRASEVSAALTERRALSIEASRRASSTAQRDALAALAGIRRDMFPEAPPYQPSPVLEKEIR